MRGLVSAPNYERRAGSEAVTATPVAVPSIESMADSLNLCTGSEAEHER